MGNFTSWKIRVKEILDKTLLNMFIWFYKSDCYDYCENELRQRRLELSPLTRRLFREIP